MGFDIPSNNSAAVDLSIAVNIITVQLGFLALGTRGRYVLSYTVKVLGVLAVVSVFCCS